MSSKFFQFSNILFSFFLRIPGIFPLLNSLIIPTMFSLNLVIIHLSNFLLLVFKIPLQAIINFLVRVLRMCPSSFSHKLFIDQVINLLSHHRTFHTVNIHQLHEAIIPKSTKPATPTNNQVFTYALRV